MKKFIFTILAVIALNCGMLRAATLTAARDTVDRYVINDEKIEKFDGKLLEGKRIISYSIRTYSSPTEGIYRVHDIHLEDPVPEAAAKDRRVNIGYGEIDDRDLSYSVASVKPKDNEAYSNMYDYLRGKVAGVVVTPDNRITIRGVTTLNSSTDPLILVDGMEISDLSIIDPHDVYSVDVLKDGSSSIYGFKGANGVIQITTKKGQQLRKQEAAERRQAREARRAKKNK